MKKRWLDRTVYAALVAACLALALAAGWTAFASQIDNAAYDWMTRLNPPPAASGEAIILAIDDSTLNAMGSIRNIRGILASALEELRAAQPKAVALDLILNDAADTATDGRLERALAATPRLVLATDWSDGVWQNPLPAFARCAAAIGHTLADPVSSDGVTRQIPLEEAHNRERHWSLALEAFRMINGGHTILESPEDLQIGSTIVPAKFPDRPLWVRYIPQGIPQISVLELRRYPERINRFAGKAVFVGVYSDTAARDRAVTPYGEHIAGVEVNAQVFETLRRGEFLAPASNSSELLVCAAIALISGLIFIGLTGWPAYLAGATALAAAHLAPFEFFRQGVIFPLFAPAATAWTTLSAAAVYQHFAVRRALRNSEHERTRYRQAIHFVTHEMRTPLTAIQGSSELIGRYALNEEKRKQIASMINSESKRLARLVQRFLDVERLSAGQMELKRDRFEVSSLIEACLERVRPLAERKNIQLQIGERPQAEITGDRELMEYAIYNLLTNAVKYSEAGTQIEIGAGGNDNEFRLWVRDEGMGVDARELKKIFKKFYRTQRAEASGEPGTGIGLSLVEQIVAQHGGRIEVVSAPGQGSCFTVVLPVARGATVSN